MAVQVVRYLTFCNLVAAQFPPKNLPFNPSSPTPKQPKEIPIQIVPRTPLFNDALPTITLKNVIFVGNTVYNNARLFDLIHQFIGKTIAQSELEQITKAVRELYINHGYINSDAVYQASDNEVLDPGNAVITIRVVEGSLGEIKLIGSSRLHTYIRQRIHRSRALNYNALLLDLRRLNADPLIESLNVKIEPSADLVNQNNLQIRYKAAPPYHGTLSIDNYGNPGTGKFRRGIEFHVNDSPIGDEFSAIWSNSNGGNALSASYSVPILPDNTTLSLLYSYGATKVIAEPLTPLNINGVTQNLSLKLTHPILRDFSNNSSTEFSLGFGMNNYTSQDSILGVNIPLSYGASDNGKTDVTVLYFSQELKYISAKNAFLLDSQFNLGLDVGSVTGTQFDKQFFYWRGNINYVHTFKDGFDFSVRASVQIANRTLVLSQQFPIGGFYSVRAYPQSFEVADNGVFVSTEFKFPLYQGILGKVSLVPFADAAYIANYSFFSSSSISAADVGLALEYRFEKSLNISLAWAYPLLDVGQISTNLRDSKLLLDFRFNF